MRNRMMAALLVLAATVAGQVAAEASASGKARKTAAPQPTISESQARSIAFRHGLVHIEEIALAESRWEIAGRDPDGAERALDLSAHDGAVLR